MRARVRTDAINFDRPEGELAARLYNRHRPKNAAISAKPYALYGDQKIVGLYGGPLFDFEVDNYEKTEANLEAESDLIHDEIAEALGAIEAVASAISGSDADDPGGDDCGEGF